MDLKDLGFNKYFQENFKEYADQGFKIGRVFAEHTHIYKLYTEIGEVLGEISGKMLHETISREDFPAVGDWVVISLREQEKRATIHKILPRKTKFSRKIAGVTTEEQILASNIDTVFLVNALNNDFNIRRIERYLILAWESGANPVIILSKADLCNDIEDIISQVELVAIGVPIHIISSINKEGIEELNEYFKPGNTVALLGSSGVGKSTLINCLLGEEVQETQGLRNDDRGRHTSTYREIFILPNGGLIIDTPGMRELQLWNNGSEGISEAFEDIETLSKQCFFNDCTHNKEPNCAVKSALYNGTLDRNRFENYKKLQKELLFIEKKQNAMTRLIEKKKQKFTSKTNKRPV